MGINRVVGKLAIIEKSFVQTIMTISIMNKEIKGTIYSLKENWLVISRFLDLFPNNLEIITTKIKNNNLLIRAYIIRFCRM
jgi:hypothetical protein